jgi:predicted hotdog family 3-hydroxylacyl-ACP dehydratase
VNARIEIPAGGGCFEGHFPGRPILPGVALLDLACRALASAGEVQPLREVAFARLRKPVAPGDRLNLAVRVADRERTRFELRRGAELVADAELGFGAPGEPPRMQYAVPALQPAVDVAAPLDALLPHRPPMRFVTSIVEQRPDGLTCQTCIPQACALVTDGCAPALAMVEAAAQTAATWEALRRMQAGAGGTARIGYLVALRKVMFFAAQVLADTPLLARVHLEDMALPLTHYQFEVSLQDVVLAIGRIATYLTEAPATE